MLFTESGRGEEDEENGTEVLFGRAELDGLVRYGYREESPIDAFDRGVRDGYTISDDRRVKFLHEGQTVGDFPLALDKTTPSESVGQDADHFIARVCAEPAYHRIIFDKIS